MASGHEGAVVRPGSRRPSAGREQRWIPPSASTHDAALTNLRWFTQRRTVQRDSDPARMEDDPYADDAVQQLDKYQP
jgi:hypothetical protein